MRRLSDELPDTGRPRLRVTLSGAVNEPRGPRATARFLLRGDTRGGKEKESSYLDPLYRAAGREDASPGVLLMTRSVMLVRGTGPNAPCAAPTHFLHRGNAPTHFSLNSYL